MALFKVEIFNLNVILSSLLGKSFFFFSYCLVWGNSLKYVQRRAIGLIYIAALLLDFLAGMLQINILKYKGINLHIFRT